MEWISSKVLLHGTENYVQHPMINHNGKEYIKKECAVIYTLYIYTHYIYTYIIYTLYMCMLYIMHTYMYNNHFVVQQ